MGWVFSHSIFLKSVICSRNDIVVVWPSSLNQCASKCLQGNYVYESLSKGKGSPDVSYQLNLIQTLVYVCNHHIVTYFFIFAGHRLHIANFNHFVNRNILPGVHGGVSWP